MSQPVNTENKEPEVKILPSETPQPEEKIQIDGETGKPIEPSAPVPQSVSPDELKKIQARMEYQARQNERLQAQLAETLQRLNRPVSQPEKQKQDDEFDPALDAIAKENWQKGVGTLVDRRAEAIAEKKFKSLMEEQQKMNQVNFQKQQAATQLERAKAWVLERNPSLNDDTSDDFKGYYATYNKMISEDPSLISNPLAPRVIWQEWQTSAKEKPNQNQEAERLKRVAATAVPQGRQLQGKKTYQLTPSEIEFCEKNKLSPAKYAQMKEANFKEGVTA